MNNELLISFTASTLCVFSRSLLSVIDRALFSSNVDFLFNIFLNSLLPFIMCFIFGLFLDINYKDFLYFTFEYNIFFAALLAQLVAYIISYALKYMPIKYVASFIKLSDILIPINIFILSNKFSIRKYKN
jgi:hypothetical protein